MMQEKSVRRADIIRAICVELERAKRLHPDWPEDPIHAVAILVEEAGESMQAALNLVYAGGDIEHLREELVQTGAMVIRAMENLK